MIEAIHGIGFSGLHIDSYRLYLKENNERNKMYNFKTNSFGFLYVGSFVKDTSKNKKNLSIKWTDNVNIKSSKPRIYILTVNDILYKIGASECKGGIKSTMQFYASGNTGSPSIRTYGINILILKEIEKGNRVDIYCREINEMVPVSIWGLGTTKEDFASVSYTKYERAVLNDYYDVFGKYPEWNYKENNEKWPDCVSENYEYIKRDKNK